MAGTRGGIIGRPEGRFEMRTQLVAAGAVLALVCLAAWGAEWKETDWGADIVLDAGTGLPAVVFHVALEYTSASGSSPVDTLWEVFAIVGGSEIPVDGISSTSIRSGETARIYAASPRVPIEPGNRYGARVTITDPSISRPYERAFDFLAPAAVPFGIPLTGWDGSEVVDLSGLPDEELEELVLLHDLLDGYARAAGGLSVDAFLRGDAATAAYPLSLLLLPTANVDTSGSPISIFVVWNLYVYTLSAPNEAAGVLSQLEQFGQEFVGDVFTGPGSPILGGGKAIFVQDAVRTILDASVVELGNR
jgi:hypothetical protein